MDMETPLEDLEALRSMPRFDGGPYVAIEIGSWAGRTAKALSDVYDRVYCIDHWQGNANDQMALQPPRKPRESFQTFCRNMGSRLFRSVIPLVGHSQTYAAIWPFPVDLIFIDGDHQYESVKTDIDAWWPHVKPGGILCGHDYGVEGLPGVKRAVDERFGACFAGRTIWWVVR